ncbi:MAG: sodium-dependent bicarbonate transport family permease [Proteobacteria bacterium]|nr:sodium-dependent bicarbonate transport family permease [Pseudomonadota bacterium]
MTLIDLAATNLLSPAILCFALGAFGVALRSEMRLPEPVFTAVSMYLMLAIGMKGGVELAGRPVADVIAPATAALVLGCLIPLWCFVLFRRFAGVSSADAAALAAHYGSVSAVTFAAVIAMLDLKGIAYEGYMPAILALMEVPAIAVAIGLAAFSGASASVVHSGGGTLAMGAPSSGIGAATMQALSSKSIVLLVGGLIIGMAAGPQGMAKVKPFFIDLLPGMLCLFLLELGRVAASRLKDFRKVGPALATLAIALPVFHAMLGLGLAYMVGLSQGGAIVLATLAASASYIAAPAAVQLVLPQANPGYYLTCSMVITFPFNIIAGLPLYSAMAGMLYR